MTRGARAPSNQLAGWGAARHHCGAGHESRINPNNLRQAGSCAAFSSLLLVWFAGDMKSERPSKDDEQHCRCVVWEEKTVLQSLEVAFSALSWKSSFLRVLHSCEGGRRLACFKEILALAERESERFSPWQSENIISDGTCALLNAQQIKMVGREARVCGTDVFEDRPRIACVHACVPLQLVGKCCALLIKPLLWHCICSIFFVRCFKSE